jgi:hypothetical protein
MPRCLIEEPDFRVVEDVVDGNVIHCLEVRDGADALGVERWKTFETRGSKNLQAIFNFLIRIAQKQEHK